MILLNSDSLIQTIVMIELQLEPKRGEEISNIFNQDESGEQRKFDYFNHEKLKESNNPPPLVVLKTYIVIEIILLK